MSKDDLNSRIARAQAELDARDRPRYTAANGGWSAGLRMASDFAAAVIVGSVLGWGLDALLGWSPWGLVCGLMLGFLAGVRNVVSAAMKAGQAVEQEAAKGAAANEEGKGDVA